VTGNNLHPTETPSAPTVSTGYRQKIDQFIDQLQERLGLGPDSDREDQPLSLTDVALLSLDSMQASIARCKLAAYPPDLLVEVPINTCQVHEFHRAREVIQAGEFWTRQALDRFTAEE
jgi:NTE family protein